MHAPLFVIVETGKHLPLPRQLPADFDDLPKWDSVARPINREPPNGLQPTARLPAPPVVRNVGAEMVARKAEEAAAIRRKYGAAAR